MDTMELVIDGSAGVYAPKYFAELFGTQLKNVSKADLETLMEGPDDEWYWEAWQNIEMNGAIEHNGEDWTIYQYEGDVWLVHPDHEWEDDWWTIRPDYPVDEDEYL